MRRLRFGRININSIPQGRKYISVPIFAVLLLFTCASETFAADEFAGFVRNVAPGIWVHFGKHVGLENRQRGDSANLSFVIGGSCVAVIDTGGSVAIGRRLKERIREITQKPVCFVINTHLHYDHVLGNNAFADEDVSFVFHRHFPSEMGANIVFFSNRFSVELEGREPAFQANRSRILVDSEMILDLGNRVLVLNAVQSSHSSTDLTVFDGSTGTFWTGDLLFRERLPVVEGSLLSWLAWMKKIEIRPFNRVIPGHGPLDDMWPKSLIPQYRYLDAVRLGVEAAIARGQDILDVPATVAKEERADWLLVKGVHEKNVYKAYQELEWR